MMVTEQWHTSYDGYLAIIYPAEKADTYREDVAS